ncbi:MAG: hypothetical protein HZC29_06680 [Thaumarchaeota archaeon]|nr:hypothetical protein [Nitrososphaerota archaeon]
MRTSQIDKHKLKITFAIFSVAMLFSGTAFSANAAMQDLSDTSIPLDIPLVMGYADGNEVFYITTEASHEEVANHLTDLLGFTVVYTPALKNTPKDALANIYEFTNGVPGPGPVGFQPNVADSQPGDPEYSPAWAVQHVTWTDESAARELTSEDEILAAQDAGELTIEETGVVVNCPFIQWEGGNLPIRESQELTDQTPYGGGQVLEIDTENMVVTFVAHRGFGPDGSTIYYIATDASAPDVAEMLGVIHVEKIGKTLVSSAASDLYVFTNGITGTGPAGFQASIGSTDAGDEFYSPFWRIQMATWTDAETAPFLTTTAEITEAASNDELTTTLGGFIVNCPFIEVSTEAMDDKMMDDSMMEDGQVMAPLKQMKEGIEPREVQCKEGLQLLLKKSDGSAVCVMPDTASVLMERGWATQP